MGKRKDFSGKGELVVAEPVTDLVVMAPNSGVMGKFLDDTANMFKARSMRMKGLFARIDETGQKMEALLRMASERADAAEARLEDHLRREGLLPQLETDTDEAAE